MVRITTDPARGGRWTSLLTGDPVTGRREWLWRRDEPRRTAVAPGDAFADAGGLEECVPTVRGTPDHGDAWSRGWARDGDTEWVRCPDFRFTRRVRTTPAGAAVADYRLTAAPGYRFLWAAHALLDVSPGGRLRMTPGAAGRRYPDGGAAWTPFAWPGPDRFDRLGPDDGTALGAIVDAAEVSVHDGPHTLRFALEAPGQPVSVALWRNLRGFPDGAPYRSTGVEPMLGRVWDVAAAGDGEAALVPATGDVRWRLTVTAAL
jgi:hypothetical protein